MAMVKYCFLMDFIVRLSMDTHDPDNIIDNTLSVRRVPTNMALQCFSSAVRQFKHFPFIWITLTLIYITIIFLGVVLPFLGILILSALPLVNGALFIAARLGDQQQSPRLENLMIFDRDSAFKLIIAGIVWSFITLFFSEFFLTLALSEIHSANMTPVVISQHLNSLSSTKWGILMLLFLIYCYLQLAYALLPGLILLNRLTPFTAWRFAISACIHNWKTVLFYFFLLFILALVATLFLGIGWIVLLPVILITHFYLWKALFVASDEIVTSPHLSKE